MQATKLITQYAFDRTRPQEGMQKNHWKEIWALGQSSAPFMNSMLRIAKIPFPF
jgi:hypothetical protein